MLHQSSPLPLDIDEHRFAHPGSYLSDSRVHRMSRAVSCGCLAAHSRAASSPNSLSKHHPSGLSGPRGGEAGSMQDPHAWHGTIRRASQHACTPSPRRMRGTAARSARITMLSTGCRVTQQARHLPRRMHAGRAHAWERAHMCPAPTMTGGYPTSATVPGRMQGSTWERAMTGCAASCSM